MNTLKYILETYNINPDENPHNMRDASRSKTLTDLFRRLGFKKGAEIGVERGMFSKRICNMNPQLKLYSIDAWQFVKGYRDHVPQERLDGFEKETRERLKSFNCEVIKGFSMDVVKNFADKSLDFVYIDAAHDYKSVKDDIGEWDKKVRKRGIVAGHDYLNKLHGTDYGVKQAVDEWVKKNRIMHLFILQENLKKSPSWFYVK